MLRIAFGVIAGIIAWLVLWFAGEQVLSSVWKDFGADQAAFQAAIEYGGQFSPATSFLATHIVLASAVSLIAGVLAALVANEKRRAPLILGILLIVLAALKAAMSWELVPVWYQGLFTAVLLPMALLGGRLRPTK